MGEGPQICRMEIQTFRPTDKRKTKDCLTHADGTHRFTRTSLMNYKSTPRKIPE
jgi:hypothetical protein